MKSQRVLIFSITNYIYAPVVWYIEMRTENENRVTLIANIHSIEYIGNSDREILAIMFAFHCII